MKPFHLILLLAYIFLIHSTSEAEAKSLNIEILKSEGVDDEVLLDAETANKVLTTTDGILGVYIEVLDRAVPWEAFEHTVTELDKHKQLYSEQTASLVGDIKSLMTNGIDAYFRASAFIFEWCDTAVPLLETYLALFKDHNVEKARAQKDLLVEVLKNGITKMRAAQDEISASSTSFNGAAGHLTTLNKRFQVEFDAKNEDFESKMKWIKIGEILHTIFGLNPMGTFSNYVNVPALKAKMAEIQKFYDDLKLQVEQAFRDIDHTKAKLGDEIMQISELKVKTEETRTFVDLDDIPDLRETLIQSGQSLMDKCNEYRRKHAMLHNRWR